MNRKTVCHYLRLYFTQVCEIGAMVVGLMLAGNALAQSGNWNVNASGNWSDSTKWSPAVVPGTNGLPDAVVGLTYNISGARTITNDCAVTLGTLNIGDPTNQVNRYTLTSGGGTLTFAVSSGSALLLKQYSTQSDTINHPLTLNSPLIISNAAAGDLILSGDIAGAGDVTVVITNGKIEVSGAITNTGNLTLKNETSTGDQVTISGLVNNYGYITNSGSGSGRARITGDISNNVQCLVQNGSSTLYLYGHNGSFTGEVIIVKGALAGGDSGGVSTYPWFGTGTITLAGGSESNNTTLIVSGLANSGTFANSITVAANNPGTATINQGCSTDSRTFSGPVTLNSHNLTVGAANNGAVILSGNITGTGSLDLYAQNDNITLSGTVNPVGAICIRGDNTNTVIISGIIDGNVTGVTDNSTSTILSLTKANTYPGDTMLNSGTFRAGQKSVGSPGSITSGPFGKGTLILNGGTLESDSGTARYILNAVTIGGDVTFAAMKTGNLTFSNAVALGAATRTLTVVSNITTFAGVISGEGGITKEGKGTLILSHPNIYNGTTTINTGMLTLTDTNSLPATTVLYINSGGTNNLNFSGTNTIMELWLGGEKQAYGMTYGGTGSGADVTNTTYFMASTGVLRIPPPQGMVIFIR